jgi:hypothetical protein
MSLCTLYTVQDYKSSPKVKINFAKKNSNTVSLPVSYVNVVYRNQGLSLSPCADSSPSDAAATLLSDAAATPPLGAAAAPPLNAAATPPFDANATPPSDAAATPPLDIPAATPPLDAAAATTTGAKLTDRSFGD